MGDRYEALYHDPASFMNIQIAHNRKRVSSSIDESTRHAITKMSHLHFPSTQRSADYIIKMGEDPNYVHNVGCPAGDSILELGDDINEIEINKLGVEPNDFSKPFLLVIYHR